MKEAVASPSGDPPTARFESFDPLSEPSRSPLGALPEPPSGPYRPSQGRCPEPMGWVPVTPITTE